MIFYPSKYYLFNNLFICFDIGSNSKNKNITVEIEWIISTKNPEKRYANNALKDIVSVNKR